MNEPQKTSTQLSNLFPQYKPTDINSPLFINHLLNELNLLNINPSSSTTDDNTNNNNNNTNNNNKIEQLFNKIQLNFDNEFTNINKI